MICRKCLEDKVYPDEFAKDSWKNVCRECYNLYMKHIHREQSNKIYFTDPEKNREKCKRHYYRHINEYRVRAKTSWAIKTGRIIKEPCKVCGNEKVQAHHLDYNDPFNIVWLCRTHHKYFHRDDTNTILKDIVNE